MNRFTKMIITQIVMSMLPFVVMAPIVFFISSMVNGLVVDIEADIETISNPATQDAARSALANGKIILQIFPIGFVILAIGVSIMRGVSFRDIFKLRDMEKKMSKLKKMGVEKFIKTTESTLVDANDKGYEMYESSNILENRKVRFVIYRDCSTNEQYISFVKPDHQTVDEAMAWKQRLTVEQYKRMELES